MMHRKTFAVGLMIALTACAGGENKGVLHPVVVIGEAAAGAGRPFQPALSPDGAKLAYAMPVNGKAAIHVASADGSNPVQLTHGAWDNLPVWSPDGRWIAYSAESPQFDVFVVPIDGGEARQLTSGPADDRAVGWLPDGSAVLFYRSGAGDDQTLAAPLDGGPVRTIVPPAGGNQYVAISPDGTKAAFDLHRGGQGTIWVQDLAGGPARQLTTEGLENANTRFMWSPDSRSVLYTSRHTGTTDIWVADVESGALRQLTSDIRNDNGARWSPDGRWVVFNSDRGGQNDVWIVPAAGGKALRVTHDLAQEGDVQWMPDGRSIVYGRYDVTSALHVMSLDGTSDRVVAGFEGYQVGNAVLSPDGKTVLFNSDRSGNQDIWSVPLAGGEPTPFAASPLNDGGPRFSPDGATVVFVSNRSGSPDLWVKPAAGGEARQLTDWPSVESGPRWSPDGSTIAFTSNRNANQNDVWTIPAAGGDAKRLTRNAAASTPYWSTDGRSIIYVGSEESGGGELYRISASGGTPQAFGVGQGDGIGNLAPSLDGSELAYGRFHAGWAYIEVVPTTGGTPRRLTKAVDDVYESVPVWSPDGTGLAVVSQPIPLETLDLLMVTWPEGTWRALTTTPDVSEFGPVWTPDGTQIIYAAGRDSSRIMMVSVAALMAEGAGE